MVRQPADGSLPQGRLTTTTTRHSPTSWSNDGRLLAFHVGSGPMRGEVISLHDGFLLDVTEVDPIPPKAIVRFESGMRLMVDERMKWERDAG